MLLSFFQPAPESEKMQDVEFVKMTFTVQTTIGLSSLCPNTRCWTSVLLTWCCHWISVILQRQRLSNTDSLNILNLERPSFTGVEKNCCHWCIVDSTFYIRCITTKALKTHQINISRSSFHYTWINLIIHPTTSSNSGTQILHHYLHLSAVSRTPLMEKLRSDEVRQPSLISLSE